MIQKDAMPRPNASEDGPNPIDTDVGAKVKTRRLMLGISQEELADSIDLTFQQVQKYERGSNRISVSRLVEISRALKTPLEFFLGGYMGAGKYGFKGIADGKQEGLEPEIKKDTLELMRAYQKIKKPALKKQLLEMAKAMANSSNDD